MKSIILIASLAVVAVYAAPAAEEVPILKQESDINPDGSFSYAYELGNGIAAEAKGVQKDAETSEVSGSYQFKGEDGTNYEIHYVANENGFQPEGAHLPQAPEIPAAIQKALEWIAAHPEPEEKKP